MRLNSCGVRSAMVVGFVALSVNVDCEVRFHSKLNPSSALRAERRSFWNCDDWRMVTTVGSLEISTDHSIIASEPDWTKLTEIRSELTPRTEAKTVIKSDSYAVICETSTFDPTNENLSQNRNI